MFQTSPEFGPKNTFIRKVFFWVVTTAIRLSDKFPEENHFFFHRNFTFNFVLEFEQFLCILAKKLINYVKSASFMHRFRILEE